jgi:hypothetical protein
MSIRHAANHYMDLAPTICISVADHENDGAARRISRIQDHVVHRQGGDTGVNEKQTSCLCRIRVVSYNTNCSTDLSFRSHLHITFCPSVIFHQGCYPRLVKPELAAQTLTPPPAAEPPPPLRRTTRAVNLTEGVAANRSMRWTATAGSR